MITVIENKGSQAGYRDFIEGIFDTRKEAESYFAQHPKKEICRVIELPFNEYPFALIEIPNHFGLNEDSLFRYFKADEELDKFLWSLDVPVLLARHKEWVKRQSWFASADESDYQNLFIINIIRESTVSSEMNLDPMGGFDHHHFMSYEFEHTQRKGTFGFIEQCRL
jgi:hypothetical protein